MTFKTSKGYLQIDVKTAFIDVKTCNEPGRKNIVYFKTKNTEKKKTTDLEESKKIHSLAANLIKDEIRERGFHKEIYPRVPNITNLLEKKLDIVFRLDGFHTLMSVIDSIGYVMGGSGLEDVLTEIYAENSILHMLSGKAYARVV